MSHQQKPTIKCSACGTSPANHYFLYISNLAEGTIGRLADALFQFTSKDYWRDLAFFVEETLYAVFSFLGVIRYNTDKSKALTGRSELVWDEADRRGIPMDQLTILGKPVELYRATLSSKTNNFTDKTIYFASLPIPHWLPQDGYKWIDDKFKLFEVLSQNGIPAPKARTVMRLKSAEKAWSELSKPIIIKPKIGSRGRHTTTNIHTKEELQAAFDLARVITPSMVIQEHLVGSVYRGTVVNNELVGFFRADPPRITGDGMHTISELIAEQNRTRPERLFDITVNDDTHAFISRKGYNMQSVLEKDAVLDLSAKTGRMYGGRTREMLGDVHPKLKEILEKAAKILVVPVVGFDLIMLDPTADPDTQRWGIIEANSLPYIDLHYFALEGPKTNLAENVWDLWELPQT